MMESINMKADVVIIGCGVGGLYAALNLPQDKKIVIVTNAIAGGFTDSVKTLH